MVSRKIIPVLLATSVAAWACSESPVSPTRSGIGGSQDALAKGKPPNDDPPPPPPPAEYTMTLSASINEDPAGPSEYEGTGPFPADDSQDGLPSPGHFTLGATPLTGNLSGPTADGHFEGTFTGSVSGLSISHVGELPDWFSGGDPCQPVEVNQLIADGLVGPNSSLGGAFTLTLSEFTLKGSPGTRGTFPRVEWTLDGVAGGWSLTGRNGNTRHNVFPVYEPGGSPDGVVVTVENSVINFIGPTYSVTSCRVDFTMTLTKVPQS